MKVTGSGNWFPDTQAPAQSEGKVTRLRTASAAPAPGGDRVSLSDLASKLQSIETEFAAQEPYDAGRVEEIKQAIRDGRFKVNPEAVADRLIESLKQMLPEKS